jgi:hypothetical protein
LNAIRVQPPQCIFFKNARNTLRDKQTNHKRGIVRARANFKVRATSVLDAPIAINQIKGARPSCLLILRAF